MVYYTFIIKTLYAFSLNFKTNNTFCNGHIDDTK